MPASVVRTPTRATSPGPGSGRGGEGDGQVAVEQLQEGAVGELMDGATRVEEVHSQRRRAPWRVEADGDVPAAELVQHPRGAVEGIQHLRRRGRRDGVRIGLER